MITLILALTGCGSTIPTGPEPDITPNSDPIEVEPTPTEDEDETVGQDVAFQNSVVMTNVDPENYPDAEGEGYYGVNEGLIKLYADFNIADPEEGFFYEGWLICGNDAISTGELAKFDGLWIDYYETTDDIQCRRYVLTIEPDDGDPAPADHVMEGEFEGIAAADVPNTPLWDDEFYDSLK